MTFGILKLTALEKSLFDTRDQQVDFAPRIPTSELFTERQVFHIGAFFSEKEKQPRTISPPYFHSLGYLINCPTTVTIIYIMKIEKKYKMQVQSKFAMEGETNGPIKLMLDETNWELWNKKVQAWITDKSKCRIWLRTGEKPVFEILEVIADRDGDGIQRRDRDGQLLFRQNPEYVGQD